MPPPKSVTMLMQMHIGRPASPTVKVGDTVYVGTLIAEANGYISSPVYSSVSGKVKKVEDTLLSNSQRALAVVIESDGNMTLDERITPPAVDSKESLVEAIRRSGIVGLGGAGFPTYVKFNCDYSKVEELVLNGAECEPYITSDTRTMIDRYEDIKRALTYFEKYFGIKKVIIGIEKKNTEAIHSMTRLAEELPILSVKTLSNKYPNGGERVLVYNTTGKVIPTGKLPLEVGCIVANVTTVASIGGYLKDGIPLVEKCVTVDGGAVKSPMNVYAPIGASFGDVIEFTGGLSGEVGKLLSGGPMMGVAVPSLDYPVLKNTNAILALSDAEARLGKTTPCIKCGRCINACPFGINPPSLTEAFGKRDFEGMIKYGALACMECGSCSFVCPTNQPLVQNHKLIKAALRKYGEEKKKTEENK